uniref:Uncharacterized protein n=1 Tax=Kwoniella bestiolae CBS 10118 TaxID=1296100 RepID=A0A1B9FYW8_9TREE|nr:hypothetical protein I302_06936 [Kwoniella bestiolae CBS 10118]OCF23950.1 hypothetical protein I302_06936 [Kwoniella bestiolae CBS 10118]
MPYPVPNITIVSAVTRSASDAALDLKLEGTFSVPSGDLVHPVHSVTFDEIQLDQDGDQNDRLCQAASVEEMKILSKDVVSRAFSLPATRRFEMWYGHLVRRPETGTEFFVPASEDGHGCRDEHANELQVEGMHNMIRNASQTGGSGSVLLECSLLVPENFSAYNKTRAPVILLSNGVDISSTSQSSCDY